MIFRLYYFSLKRFFYKNKTKHPKQIHILKTNNETKLQNGINFIIDTFNIKFRITAFTKI